MLANANQRYVNIAVSQIELFPTCLICYNIVFSILA